MKPLIRNIILQKAEFNKFALQELYQPYFKLISGKFIAGDKGFKFDRIKLSVKDKEIKSIIFIKGDKELKSNSFFFNERELKIKIKDDYFDNYSKKMKIISWNGVELRLIYQYKGE